MYACASPRDTEVSKSSCNASYVAIMYQIGTGNYRSERRTSSSCRYPMSEVTIILLQPDLCSTRFSRDSAIGDTLKHCRRPGCVSTCRWSISDRTGSCMHLLEHTHRISSGLRRVDQPALWQKRVENLQADIRRCLDRHLKTYAVTRAYRVSNTSGCLPTYQRQVRICTRRTKSSCMHGRTWRHDCSVNKLRVVCGMWLCNTTSK